MKIEPYLRMTQYYETDQMGVVHHANYIYWMEEARVDYMEKIGFGYEKAVEAGLDFALTGLSCEYKGMTRFREQIRIEIWLREVTPVRLTVGYRGVGVSDEQLRFSGETRHCYFSKEKQRPIALSRELPELYKRFCELAWDAPSEEKPK